MRAVRFAVRVGLAGALALAPMTAFAAQEEPAAAHAEQGTHVHEHSDQPAVEPAEKAEGHEASEEHAAPKPINWFDFSNAEQPPYGAMLINFVLLMWMYYALGKKPIAQALKDRRAGIAKEIEEADKIRKEAEARAVVYQEKLKNLESELKETRAALVEAGKGERTRIIREAEEKAARMEKDAAFLVEQEIKQLRVDLTREAIEMAVSAAEELLKKRVAPADQERLAEDYLTQLSKNKPSTPSIPVRAPAGGQS